VPEHEELNARIPAYVREELDPSDRLELETHLGGCPQCAARLESARLLAGAMRDAGEELFAGHPDELTLRQHALDLLPAGAGAIDRHLASCAACALEVSVWKRGAVAAPGLSWKQLLTAAAGVAIGIGVVLALRQPPVPSPVPAPATAEATGPAPFLLLQGPLRGEGRPPVLSVPDDAPYLLIAVSPLIPSDAPDETAFRLEIRVPGGGPSWSVDLPAGRIREEVRTAGILVLPVPAAALPAGVYDLRLLEASDPVGPPIIDWRFEIAP
jgi:anti-sigma factor RsiW